MTVVYLSNLQSDCPDVLQTLITLHTNLKHFTTHSEHLRLCGNKGKEQYSEP
jgi:hypothetical protein